MFEFSSILQYNGQLQSRAISCEETVLHYFEKIRNTKHLNAFVEVYADEALQRAKALDERRMAGQPLSSLHGVIVAIKDVIAYKDHRLTASSKILSGFHSIYSSTVVEKLLAAEAIIIGCTNCDEFAMGSSNENSAYGPVLNAADETKVPGGSSGGSAVAVQAGLCMVSIGSDTGGSVRQPAGFCGIVGLKPTYGRVSRYGLIAYASSFDQVGIFTKNIPDASILLQVIAGYDEFDSTVSDLPVPGYSSTPATGKKFRFAYFPELFNHPSLDPEISSGIKTTMEVLKKEGHAVESIAFNFMDFVVPAYYVLTTAEASSNLSRYDGVRFGHRTKKAETDLAAWYKQTRTEGFGLEVKRRIMLGSFVLSTGYYDAYFTKAQQARQLLLSKIREVFANHDFILMPVSPTTAFDLGDNTQDPVAMYLADIFTVMANLVGCPAVSLPIYQHTNGLPFGLQVMATHFDELSLLQVSGQLMSLAGRSS